MPVIRPSGRSRAADSLKLRLTDLLIKELMGESVNNGPVVFEDPSEPDAINVIVVWEAWVGLSPSDRTAIIRAAYARYSLGLERGIHHLDPALSPDLPIASRLTMALGTTLEEVEELGLLPYTVRPDAPAGVVDPDEVETALIEAGALQTPDGFKLRLPNLRMASEVHGRLVQEVPGARWSIHHQIGMVED